MDRHLVQAAHDLLAETQGTCRQLIQWDAPGSLSEDRERTFAAVLSYVLEIVYQLQERAPTKQKLRFLAGE